VFLAFRSSHFVVGENLAASTKTLAFLRAAHLRLLQAGVLAKMMSAKIKFDRTIQEAL